jgi:hypothetical protein
VSNVPQYPAPSARRLPFLLNISYSGRLRIGSWPSRVSSMRKSVDMAKVAQALQTNAWADPASYAGQFGPAVALFQYGLHDEDWVPLQDAKD